MLTAINTQEMMENEMHFVICLLGCFIVLPAFMGIVPQSHVQSDLPDSFTIRIPGTTIPFTMILCPATPLENLEGSTESTESLYVLSTEVTWDLYDIFIFELDEPDGSSAADAVTRPSKPYIPPDRGFGHEGYPAIGMTRSAAESFCEWLSLKTGLAIRLPTQREWAFIAVGNSDDPYCCGIDADSLDQASWFVDNAEHTSHPVGQKQPNRFGLFDIHGNAAEWVITDTRKPIAMGGSFRDAAEECESTSTQKQLRSWNVSDPQIPKSQWWLADCSWVGFRFIVNADSINETTLKEITDD